MNINCTSRFLVSRCPTIFFTRGKKTMDTAPKIEERLLPEVSHVPLANPIDLPYKHPRANDDIIGPERVHNQLIYRQYGIIALGGGSLVGAHFDFIRGKLNRRLDTDRFFAIWRVDPPWKPVSKKSFGKKQGGGKNKVHHYSTPVKAGRIILEVAGIGEYGEIESTLVDISEKLPFWAMPITQQRMDELVQEKLDIDRRNFNPFTYRYILRNNFSNYKLQASPKELAWGGTAFC